MTDLTAPTDAIVTGVRRVATKLDLKTGHSLAAAAASDPLAFQVGADLGQRLGQGQPTSLSEVQACEANKPCAAGMLVSVEAGNAGSGGGDGFVKGGVPLDVVRSVQRQQAPAKSVLTRLNLLTHGH